MKWGCAATVVVISVVMCQGEILKASVLYIAYIDTISVCVTRTKRKKHLYEIVLEVANEVRGEVI